MTTNINDLGIFNVKLYGAVGNAVTDDSVSIQNTINAASVNGGTVFFPSGNYLCRSPLNISAPNLEVMGTESVEIQAGDADTSLFHINAPRVKLRDLTLSGCGIRGTQPTLRYDALAVDCLISDCYIVGGQHSIYHGGVELSIERSYIAQSYSSAIIYSVVQGLYLTRVKMDQDWPVSTPPSGSTFVSWAASTSYNVGDVRSQGGYYIQCSVAGTSGVSPPMLANYQQAIHDGSAQWLLAGSTMYYPLFLDTGSGVVIEYNCDHTGCFTAGVGMFNSQGGFAPQDVVLNDPVFGQCTLYCVDAQAGSGLTINGGILSGVLHPSGCAVNLATGFVGDTAINNILAFGCPIGVYAAAGKNLAITGGNRIFGASLGAIIVAPNVSNVVITGNLLGSSPTWGANNYPVWVQPGNGDYINITNNIVKGAKQPITYQATGTHKFMSGNF